MEGSYTRWSRTPFVVSGALKPQPGDLPLVALVVLTILVGVIAYNDIGANRLVLHEAQNARIHLQTLSKITVDEETAMRGYVGSGDRRYLAPYESDATGYRRVLEQLHDDLRTRDFSKIRAWIDEYDRMHETWIDRIVRPLIAAPSRPDRKALQIDGEQRVASMKARSDAIDQALDDFFDVRALYYQRVVLTSYVTIVALTVLLGTAALRTLRGRYRAEQKLRAQLAERNSALERSNEALQEFAYVASHDLREPLRTVASFTELLQKRYAGKLDEQADEYIGYAVDGARRMQALIDDILLYSRVTTHGKSLETMNLRVAVDAAIANLRSTIEERRALVIVGRLPDVLGDRTQLSQLFQNLIENAIKYNTSEAPRVEMHAETNGTSATVRVLDNGIGIHGDYHERVFRVFSRLHTREEYPGTGIGLAICKRIVERHGGRIWIDSSEGHGATFSFTLHRAEEAK